jgi:hypothetical protein
MRAKEFLAEATDKKLGRDLNHLEDFVFFYGSAGAAEAVNNLESYTKDTSGVAIKWDGQMAIYWGRDDVGDFQLLPANNWGRAEGKVKSAEELGNFFTSRGKGEPWRAQLASDLESLWPIFEAATPKNFRGYLFGDLLYHPGKQKEDLADQIKFTPNKTTYVVNKNSAIGKAVASTQAGISAHGYYKHFGDAKDTMQSIPNVERFSSADLLVMGPVYMDKKRPKVKSAELKKIRDYINLHSSDIDNFLRPKEGLSDLKQIIYTYVNTISKARQLDQLEHGFWDWLKASKVSAPKQAKIAELSRSMPTALPAILHLVVLIMNAKNHVIDQLDTAGHDVTAYTGGERGGEGYVVRAHDTKLVPRHRWQPN